MAKAQITCILDFMFKSLELILKEKIQFPADRHFALKFRGAAVPNSDTPRKAGIREGDTVELVRTTPAAAAAAN